ncbi:MAG: hypothetical protein HY677_00620 [Chloroflexi bacterium]|nr:hypothetical protein [Chloroflexota bacterium]
MGDNEKMFRCEYSASEGLLLRFSPGQFKLLPSETRAHMRAARREMLLALRSLVDAAIETTDEAAAKRRPTRIEVQ